MDALYYIFGILLILVLPLAFIFIIVAIIRPKILGLRKRTGKPTHRGKIAAAGTGSLVALFFVFGIGLGATEPESIKADRAMQATITAQAEKDTQLRAERIKEQQLKEELQKAEPIVKVEVEKEVIVYESTEKNDATLPVGERKVGVAGVNGEYDVTYDVTYKRGVEISRTEKSRLVSKQPVAQVTLVGTYVKPTPKPATKPTPAPAPKPASSCDPNYSGACVPIASDVDCAGGSGNGPAYVRGPVRIIGTDIYGLDGKDNDGIGCE